MPVTGKIVLYSFNELDGAARARARDWYKQNMMPVDWDHAIIEHMTDCARTLGIEIENVFYDGLLTSTGRAAFEGFYKHRSDAQEAIRQIAPMDKNLHAIADMLESVQSLYRASDTTQALPPLAVMVDIDPSVGIHGGPDIYVHTQIDKGVAIGYPDKGHHSAPAEVAANRGVTAVMQMFMDWIYQTLCAEYRYVLSDEHIGETLMDQGYLFTENGIPMDPRQLQ